MRRRTGKSRTWMNRCMVYPLIHDRRLCVDLDVQRTRRFPNTAKSAKAQSHKSRIFLLPSDNQQPRTYDPNPVPTPLPGAHSLSSFSRLPTAWKVLSPASSPIHAPTSQSSPAPVKQPFESDRDSVNAWLLVQHPAHRTTEPSRHPTCTIDRRMQP